MNQMLLLADASATIQRIVELTFAAEDIAVVPFSDGEHAIASLDQHLPDIVLADVGMPGRSGYEIARYIKNSPPLAHIPVLLLTGAFEPVDQTKALEAGCDGILIKPFEPQFVVSRVKELLRRPKPGTKEAEVEEYFEELDKAFANLSASSPVVELEPAAESTLAAPGDLSVAHDEVPAPLEPERPADVPVSSAPADRAFEAPEPAAVVPNAAEPAIIAAAVTEPAAFAPRPSLAEAFAALLAAERSVNGSTPLTAAFAPRVKSLPVDDIIEQVTRRVIAQMTDSVVRETVTTIVSGTAERLVLEEIERIKSNIK